MSVATTRAEPKDMKLRIKKYERDIVYVWVVDQKPDPSTGLYDYVNPCPFSAKVLLYLLLRKIPYSVRSGSGQKSRGGLPFAEYNGVVYCQSETIIQALDELVPVSEAHPRIPYSSFARRAPDETDAGWAIATSMQRIIESELHFLSLYYFFLHPMGDAHNHVFDSMAWPCNRFVKCMVRKKVAKCVKCQGTGSKSEEERVEMITRDLLTLSHTLGDNEFFIGNSISLTDLIVYQFIDSTLQAPWKENPLTTILKTHANLLTFHERIKPLVNDAYRPR